MPIEKIILLEDDLIVRKHLEQHLRSKRFDVAATDSLASAREYLNKDNFDVVIADVRLPDGEGTELLEEIQSRPVKPLVIIMTGFGSVESAVACMRAGAFDYLIKPFSNDQIDFTLKKAAEYTHLQKVNRVLSQDDDASSEKEILGSSPAINDLRALIRKVARTEATVLIQGESGTGKELVARALHMQSPRANAPFIRINCAAVPENLIESEFFGHEKGAFTGAVNKREGRFELAHGGTILLDEVSEVLPTVQAKLLRVLQERELERVGGNRTIKVDVRVIATTNRDLEKSVERNEFRQDLFFRLNVVPLYVPPLRERQVDIRNLAEQFMKRFARKHGIRVQGISAECLDALMRHTWPGNVRELQNVLERAVILSSDGDLLEVSTLGLANLPPRPTSVAGVSLPSSSQPSAPAPAPSPTTPPIEQAAPDGPQSEATTSAPIIPNGTGDAPLPSLADLEKEHIFRALEHCNNNRTHAAKLLGISIRTLRNKLNEYNAQTDDDPGDE